MSKNTKTYLLLAAVILIWSLVIYTVFTGRSEESVVESSNEITQVERIEAKKKDTFSIKANYRDPFLGTLAKKKTKKRVVKPVKKAEPEISIQYTGFVTDQNTKNKIFFVTINGKQHLMNVNDEIEKVRLISGSESKIRIRANGKTKSIDLKQ